MKTAVLAATTAPTALPAAVATPETSNSAPVPAPAVEVVKIKVADADVAKFAQAIRDGADTSEILPDRIGKLALTDDQKVAIREARKARETWCRDHKRENLALVRSKKFAHTRFRDRTSKRGDRRRVELVFVHDMRPAQK